MLDMAQARPLRRHRNATVGPSDIFVLVHCALELVVRNAQTYCAAPSEHTRICALCPQSTWLGQDRDEDIKSIPQASRAMVSEQIHAFALRSQNLWIRNEEGR